MTATQVIWLLFIGMMVNFAGMRHFWLRSEEAEKEVKRLKSENAEKARQLAEWGKYAPFLATHGAFEVTVANNSTGHPCVGYGTGWGSADANGVHTCKETCEKLAAWNKQ